jgi:hypothetical protein
MLCPNMLYISIASLSCLPQGGILKITPFAIAA